MRLCPVTGIANLFNCRKLSALIPGAETIGSQGWKRQGSTTIPKGSTPQAIGGGNGRDPETDREIV